MPFELMKNLLDALRRYYPNATLSEVAVCCTHQMMVSVGYHPTLTELAESSGASLSSVSRWMAKYGQDGLVETRPDPDDERAIRVYQTDAGRAFKAQLQEALLEASLVGETG